jgi:hypothetical protein
MQSISSWRGFLGRFDIIGNDAERAPEDCAMQRAKRLAERPIASTRNQEITNFIDNISDEILNYKWKKAETSKEASKESVPGPLLGLAIGAPAGLIDDSRDRILKKNEFFCSIKMCNDRTFSEVIEGLLIRNSISLLEIL